MIAGDLRLMREFASKIGNKSLSESEELELLSRGFSNETTSALFEVLLEAVDIASLKLKISGSDLDPAKVGLCNQIKVGESKLLRASKTKILELMIEMEEPGSEETDSLSENESDSETNGSQWNTLICNN